MNKKFIIITGKNRQETLNELIKDGYLIINEKTKERKIKLINDILKTNQQIIIKDIKKREDALLLATLVNMNIPCTACVSDLNWKNFINNLFLKNKPLVVDFLLINNKIEII